jgi:hypothetical protein
VREFVVRDKRGVPVANVDNDQPGMFAIAGQIRWRVSTHGLSPLIGPCDALPLEPVDCHVSPPYVVVVHLAVNVLRDLAKVFTVARGAAALNTLV